MNATLLSRLVKPILSSGGDTEGHIVFAASGEIVSFTPVPHFLDWMDRPVSPG